MKGEDLSKKEAERRILKQKESLRETIKMLKLIFEYAKQLKEEKENNEREIGSPILEFIWEQEYKHLGDVIDVLEMHEFML
jgi:hypothetical protein